MKNIKFAKEIVETMNKRDISEIPKGYVIEEDFERYLHEESKERIKDND